MGRFRRALFDAKNGAPEEVENTPLGVAAVAKCSALFSKTDSVDHYRGRSVWCGKDAVECVLDGKLDLVCEDYKALDTVGEIVEMQPLDKVKYQAFSCDYAQDTPGKLRAYQERYHQREEDLG